MSKYIITYANSYDAPYRDGDKMSIVHSWSDSYETDDYDQCIQILKDVMDIPVGEMSIKTVMHDFSDAKYKVSEQEANRIMNYYNGRLALYKKLEADLMSNDKSTTYKYDIPIDYNVFIAADDNKQLYSYIEVKVQ